MRSRAGRALLAAALVALVWLLEPEVSSIPSLHVIVQGRNIGSVRDSVLDVGGTITHDLGIINAVGARLSVAQAEALRRSGRVRLYENRGLRTTNYNSTKDNGNRDQYTHYPALVSADRLHKEGIFGTGVTVAVVDTGLWAGTSADKWLTENIYGEKRLLTRYDSIRDLTYLVPEDPSGHGTHVTSVIANSHHPTLGGYDGVAPNVNLVAVTAFNGTGSGTYLDVIQGIDRIVRYKDIYKIRVLNLSFSALPRSHYWDDPLNQAVMRAWQAGIVVVASAGNTGPNPMSIGVPGNVPYIITVGAMTDHYTPDSLNDDYLASFSSTGPTVEGFVKPDLVAPGGHMLGLMDGQSALATGHAEFQSQGSYFTMSGTSQAAAVVSGVVALMLEHQPTLTPDDVKCRLMASARAAVDASGNRAYSIFQQGAGRVDAYAAAYSTNAGCANLGMDVGLDLAGLAHYGGPANRDPNGSYYLMGLSGDGYVWNGGYLWSNGYLWSTAYLWSDGYLWSSGYLWSDGYLWSSAYLWSGGYLWSTALVEPMSINAWVDPQ